MRQLIERKQYMQTLRNLKDQNIIKVITGVRRGGKSTLLQMFADELLQNGVTPEQIQFYNFEDLDTLALGDIFQIHTHIKNKLIGDKMNYIFLDEVQNVKDFQRLVDSLFIKKKCDVYITGSNAYLLSGELATLLTGRYIETEILPFSYAEYVNFLALNAQKIENIADDNEDKFPKLHKKESFGNLTNPQKLIKKESFGNLIGGNIVSFDMMRNEQLIDYLYNGGMPYVSGFDDALATNHQRF